MGCCFFKIKLNKELEDYAKGLNYKSLYKINDYLERSPMYWPNSSLRNSALRALIEAQDVKEDQRLDFLKTLPEELTTNYNFHNCLCDLWTEIILEENILF